ncbi:MAG TPA: type II toxin-antitoxin system RelE/ParE family toxin [Thermoanaerobaculia bacterium]|nr:type II toxin-antitoxin system RelE/ParE family toxin [Thermoanaerobaculia bacterium]
MVDKAYTIEFTHRAEKVFRALPPEIRRRLAPKIDALKLNPRPRGVKSLEGPEGILRMRVGDYRILYRILDDRVVVLLVKIGHRPEIYR